VAHLTILTKTRGAACGFRCQYKDGAPASQPTPLAANQGTCITVEDLFYNVPQRRDALRSAGEEFHKIAEVVSRFAVKKSYLSSWNTWICRYAVHNAGVGMVLKKAGETGVSVKTVAAASVIDNIRTIYGPAVAKELVAFEMEEAKMKFSVKGQISNVNYNVKKFVFLLFINNRLVESTALRKAVEEVYKNYLPKGSSPFVYLSLLIAPENVDVNVHPTKHEVFFLHQDAIIEKIQQALEAKLLNSNASRTFYTQKLLPGAGLVMEIFENKEKAVAAKDMIRTDANLQKLDRFVTRTSQEAPEQREQREERAALMVHKEPEEEPVEMEMEAEQVARVELASVQELRQAAAAESSPECRTILAGLAFVGCVDRRLALVQHSTRLYITNTTVLSRHLFRQLLLRDFGRLGVLRLAPPPAVEELALLALEQPEAGWRPEDGAKEVLARQVAGSLADRAVMLADYFSLVLEPGADGRLAVAGVPALLEGHCPWWPGLPLYLLRYLYLC
jgi:DNA mismatch repair protein MLH1